MAQRHMCVCARAAIARDFTNKARLAAVRAACEAVVRGAYARTGVGAEGVTGAEMRWVSSIIRAVRRRTRRVPLHSSGSGSFGAPQVPTKSAGAQIFTCHLHATVSNQELESAEQQVREMARLVIGDSAGALASCFFMYVADWMSRPTSLQSSRWGRWCAASSAIPRAR